MLGAGPQGHVGPRCVYVHDVMLCLHVTVGVF